MTTTQTPELEAALRKALDRHASDLHFAVGEPPIFRVHGLLERSQEPVLTAETIRRIVSGVLSEDLRRRLDDTGYARTNCNFLGLTNGQFVVTKALGDFTITIRLLPGTLPTQAQGRLPEAVKQAAQAAHGLIIIGGEVGSGKTTCALLLLDHINATRPVHICTFEDPVMVRLTPKQALIQQHEIGVDVESTVVGLRRSLTYDVDVLFLGELRSLDELSAAVTAAQIGCLVVVVAHGSSPENIIERFIDAMPKDQQPAFRKMLARVLLTVSVQRLLPRANGPGRVPTHGVLVPDEALRQALIAGQPLTDWKASTGPGSRTMADDVRELLREGQISEETAQGVIADLAPRR